MRLCTIRLEGEETAAVAVGDGLVPVKRINAHLGRAWPTDLLALIRQGLSPVLLRDAERTPGAIAPWDAAFAPLYRHPRKIWGIGLNYRDHAADLGADPGDAPASWMRPASTLAGDGASLKLPEGVGRVTAEAEIAVILGRRARNLGSRKEARDAVFGFTPALDLTAEELLQKNARYLTQAKSYDGFCVLGPFVVTADEWEPTNETRIVTIVDGQTKDGNVAQMRHDPYELIRNFSHVFAWEPGDVLLTGTPGALALRSGSTMRAQIDGLPALIARVA